MPFIKTCRYGHGDLVKVDEKGNHPKWALMSVRSSNDVFVCTLYACKTCGYLELFDDNIALTTQRNS